MPIPMPSSWGAYGCIYGGFVLVIEARGEEPPELPVLIVIGAVLGVSGLSRSCILDTTIYIFWRFLGLNRVPGGRSEIASPNGPFLRGRGAAAGTLNGSARQ